MTLLPVTKGVSSGHLHVALAAGLTVFGENRVQDAESKASDLPAARWELVGRLQSNKAARAVALFEVIQTVDSVELARRLARLVADDGAQPARKRLLAVYLQVNVDDDPTKAGFTPSDLVRDLADIAALDNLELRGLMTVGRLVAQPADARPTFVRLRELSEQLRRDQPKLGAGLSMGMSADFEVAVEEGATVVRIGSAIFGPRLAG